MPGERGENDGAVDVMLGVASLIGDCSMKVGTLLRLLASIMKPWTTLQCFYYLGSQIHYQQAMTGDAEITSRLDMAESKFYEYGKNFMNYKIKLSVRISILNSLV